MDDFGDDRDETKRRSRNQSEKKRRDQFNVLVSELSTMITSGSPEGNNAARKMDKTTVLLNTIDFLKKHSEAKSQDKNSGPKDHINNKNVPEWKPPFLSNDEFVHLMLEAVDGFVLALSVTDNGRVLYASEGITWLLGHLPNALVDKNVSIYDMVAHEDTEILKSTLTDKCAEDSLECDEMHRPTIDLYVHIDKGGAKKEAGQSSNEFIKLSGYFAKWSFKSLNDSKRCDERCDEQCLPPSEDEDSMSTRSGTSSHVSKHIPNMNSASAMMNSTCEDQNVFICTARLMSPQLLRDMPVVHDAKGEFVSRYSLEWKFLYLDNRAPPIIGYLSFEVLGTSGYDYYHPDDLDKLVACHENLMQTGEATSCYHRFLTKGQQWIWLQARYFITYHQWNSKPEFIFATHHVISYKKVLEDLKERNHLIESQPNVRKSNAGASQNNAASDASEKSYVPLGPSSPTWSSKSSMCGSTGTGVTSRHSQSSCRLSGYSDQVSHVAGMAQTSNMAAVARAGTSADSAGAAQVSETMSYDAFNDSMNVMTSMETGLVAAPGAAVVTTNSGEVLTLQAAPAMEVTGQALRSPIFMTPMQVQMYQQLKAKHAELFKKIIEQQEELHKVSEQLLMTQYGLMPVNLAPVDQQQQQQAVQNQTNANFTNMTSMTWQQQQNDLQNQSKNSNNDQGSMLQDSSMQVNQLQASMPMQLQQQQQQRNFMQQQQL